MRDSGLLSGGITAKQVFRCYSSPDWEKNQYLMKMLISNEPDHIPGKSLHSEGRENYLGNLTCSRYESSAGEVFTIGIIEDVTQNKEAELAAWK